MKYGQFVAFMGPSYLPSDAERQEWRREGALAMNHAVELGADVQLGIAASAMLDSRFGERRTAIQFLQHAYALAPDDATRQEIAARLEMMQASEMSDRARDLMNAIEARWRAEYPFLDRGTYMLLGPVTDAVACTGPGASTRTECARDWDRALLR